MLCMMSLFRLFFNVWYEFICFFYVRYGIILFYLVVMLFSFFFCLFRRILMRDCMFWLFSWVFFTVCISLEELVREFLK